MNKALCQIFLAGVLLFLFPLASIAQDVTVRAAVHPGYGRIVFDWLRDVPYQVRIENRQLVVEFDEASGYQFGSLGQGLRGYTGKPVLDSSKKRISFPLLDDFVQESSKSGTKVIVDLRIGDTETAENPTKPAAVPQPVLPKQVPPAVGTSGPASTVGFRFAEHPDYNRLVVDWPSVVKGKLAQQGDRLVVDFDKAANVDFSQLNRTRMPLVQSGRVLEQSPGLKLEFNLAPGSEARLFNVGPKSVIDIKPRDSQIAENQKTAEPAKAAVPAPAVRPTEPTKASTTNEPTPAGTSSPQVTLPKLDELAGSGPLSLLPKPAGVEEAKPEVENKPETTAATSKSAPLVPGIAGLTPSEQAPSKPGIPSGKSADVTKPDPGTTATEQPENARKRLSGESRNNTGPVKLSELKFVDSGEAGNKQKDPSGLVAQDLVTLTEPLDIPFLVPPPGRSADLLPPTILNFNWPEPTGAAVFRRGEHLWLVFDRQGPENLHRAIEQMAPQFAPVDTLPIEGATVLRLSAPETQVPRMSKEGNRWTVDIRRRSSLPVQAIVSDLGQGEDGPEVRFLVKSVTRLLSLSHPELGDRLIVAPIAEPNLGSPKIDEFLQFRALPSYQGVVLQPTAEGLIVALTPRAVVVRSREELLVSGETARSLPRGGEVAPVPPIKMLDLQADRRGGESAYLGNLQKLQRAVTEATGLQQGLARLDLARFFFAHGRITEAIGMLELVAQENRRLSEDPSFKLLLGASQFLSDNFEEAEKTLADSALAGEWETALWQAALAASGQDWGPAAIGFAEADSLIDDLPPNVRNRLYFLAADTALHVGDTGKASLYLGKVLAGNPTEFETAQVDFLEGQRLFQDGMVEEAREIWKGLKYNRHRPTSARARHALTKLGIEEGTLAQEEGIEQLEQLRFAWRGDKFEFAILNELGDRYAEALDYRKSLHSLRQAASYFPHSDRADQVAKRMKEIFEGMYIEDGGSRIPPLSSIALYEEFKELTPLGEKGEMMIAKLADRLVDVDLLEQAGDLLADQVTYRLEGEEKARVGTRLSLIRLLEGAAEQSLTALDETEVSDMPEALKQQRLHLRARAMAELSQEDQALDLLAEDDSLDALRLKSDILWKMRRWNEAGKSLGKLIPSSPPTDRPLNEEESQAVINLAIAQTLAGDNEGLQLLRDNYGAVMGESPRDATFRLLTGSLDSGAVKSIAEELKQITQIQAFMDLYRERLESTPLSAIN
ncbi:hypothetical protein O4H49_06825 [Kiloniella laminariae]|uniref:AMIN domain-containing protein n=1 Tax=Kiloniella laminariae TaxID=454162 RepID=A0ABT4LHA3_9PROT|nr:hypothetical protein [Kiloniella laminariae]MCZ4280483.1 hypothetical protein [Kiloniella laminariae]